MSGLRLELIDYAKVGEHLRYVLNNCHQIHDHPYLFGSSPIYVMSPKTLEGFGEMWFFTDSFLKEDNNKVLIYVTYQRG